MVVADEQTYVRPNPETLNPAMRSLLKAIADCLPGAFLVGGALRDLLSDSSRLNRASLRDVDLLVPNAAAAGADSLAEALGGHAFVLDSERGQHRVALEPGAAARNIDISAFEDSVGENLRGRDFSVNAMAAPIETGGALGEVIDPCGGLADLEAKRLRMVSEEALAEDPLRLMRAARQATELEFEIEPETAAAIRRRAPGVTQAAGERQRDEFFRILATPHSAAGVRLLDELSLLTEILPELAPARGVSQPGPHHYWDVFNHSVQALANLDMMLGKSEEVEPESQAMREIFDQTLLPFELDAYFAEKVQGESRLVLLKLAGLLHDVSKPETKTLDDDGNAHFYGHSELGATKVAVICRRLRLGKEETGFVALLVEEHLRPTQLSSRGQPPSQRALYRFFRDLDSAATACLILLLADGAASAGPRLKRDGWIRSVGFVRYLLERHQGQIETVEKQPRLITGEDLMKELLIEQGPLVGRLMRSLDEAIGAGEISSREAGLEFARSEFETLKIEDSQGEALS